MSFADVVYCKLRQLTPGVTGLVALRDKIVWESRVTIITNSRSKPLSSISWQYAGLLRVCQELIHHSALLP